MSDIQVLKDNVIISRQFDFNDRTFIANDVNFFLDVSLLHDDARFGDGVLARVDTFDQVDSREWLNLIQSFL